MIGTKSLVLMAKPPPPPASWSLPPCPRVDLEHPRNLNGDEALGIIWLIVGGDPLEDCEVPLYEVSEQTFIVTFRTHCETGYGERSLLNKMS